MPNPNDPDEAECQTCFDTGAIPGTYDVCMCITRRTSRSSGVVSGNLPLGHGFIPGDGETCALWQHRVQCGHTRSEHMGSEHSAPA